MYYLNHPPESHEMKTDELNLEVDLNQGSNNLCWVLIRALRVYSNAGVV
jgi:hypothetical protein